jgi:hypothetical protein
MWMRCCPKLKEYTFKRDLLSLRIFCVSGGVLSKIVVEDKSACPPEHALDST